MPIGNPDIIDLIGLSKQGNEVSMVISDHLDWQDFDTHCGILQTKLNRYIDVVESGEIYEIKKEALGRKIVIEVFGKYPLPPEAAQFYRQVNDILTDIDLEMRFIPSMQ